MAGNCGATDDAGRSNAPMPGSVSSAAFWFVTNIFLPSISPSSTSPACGSRYENVFETLSKDFSKKFCLIEGPQSAPLRQDMGCVVPSHTTHAKISAN